MPGGWGGGRQGSWSLQGPLQVSVCTARLIQGHEPQAAALPSNTDSSSVPATLPASVLHVVVGTVPDTQCRRQWPLGRTKMTA